MTIFGRFCSWAAAEVTRPAAAAFSSAAIVAPPAAVANMPGAVPRTSTLALTNATLPFVIALAEKGWRKALADDPHLRNGLNVHAGTVTYEAVARDLNLPYAPPEMLLAA